MNENSDDAVNENTLTDINIDTANSGQGILWFILFNPIAVAALVLAGFTAYWEYGRDFDDVSLGILNLRTVPLDDNRISVVLDYSISNRGTRPAIVTTVQLMAVPPDHPGGLNIFPGLVLLER